MATIVSTLRYACDVSVDFTGFVAGEFSPANLKKSKNFSSAVGLVEKIASYMKCRGINHPGLTKLGEQCKAYKVVTRAFNFICVTPKDIQDVAKIDPSKNSFNSREMAAVKNVMGFVSGTIENAGAFASLVDQWECLPINKVALKSLAGVGELAGGVCATFSLVDDANKIAQEAWKAPSKDRTFTILAKGYDLIKDIMFIALSALGAMTTFTTMVIAVPVWVFPTVLISASILGLFSKYVMKQVTPGYGTVLPAKEEQAPKPGVDVVAA